MVASGCVIYGRTPCGAAEMQMCAGNCSCTKVKQAESSGEIFVAISGCSQQKAGLGSRLVISEI